MAATAFVLGFFTAIGWWTANKITKEVDKHIEPTTITQEVKKDG